MADALSDNEEMQSGFRLGAGYSYSLYQLFWKSILIKGKMKAFVEK